MKQHCEAQGKGCCCPVEKAKPENFEAMYEM